MDQVSSGHLGEEKHCVVCGRRFGWRLRWARDWADIRHCGSRCARRRLTPVDSALEETILTLLRDADRLISPNEAARGQGRGWRSLTERARDAARRLAARGLVDFVQGERLVDASSAKGPVQLRLHRTPGQLEA